MRYSRTAVLLAAALSLTALTAPATAQAASTAASAYTAAPKAHHARHRFTFVPREATAQVPLVPDSSCHLEIYDSFGVRGGGPRYTTTCGPR